MAMERIADAEIWDRAQDFQSKRRSDDLVPSDPTCGNDSSLGVTHLPLASKHHVITMAVVSEDVAVLTVIVFQ